MTASIQVGKRLAVIVCESDKCRDCETGYCAVVFDEPDPGGALHPGYVLKGRPGLAKRVRLLIAAVEAAADDSD